MRPLVYLVVTLSVCAQLVCAAEIELKNDHLSLHFDGQTGSLVNATTSDGLRLFGSESAPVDIHAGGKWCFSEKTVPRKPGTICLDGEWDFRIEGGDWHRLRVPGFWEEQGVTQVLKGDPDPNWKPYNGFAYYRTTFDALDEWRGKQITLVIFGVDDEDWTSVNGKPVGHTGMDIENWWSATRSYGVPSDILKFDAPNTLDIKVYDRGGEGGIAGSVLIGPLDDIGRQQPCSMRLDSHHIDSKNGMKVLTMNCSAPDWEVKITYEIPDKGPYFKRSARWRYVGDTPTSVTCVRYNLPQVCINLAEDSAYTLPTLWPPMDIPFTELHQGRRQRAHASGAIPPAVALYNRKHRLGLCAALYTEEEWHGVIVEEGPNFIDIHAEAYPAGPIEKGDSIELGHQLVMLSEGTMLDAIRATREAWRLAGFRLAERPEWAYGASLYSLWAGGSTDSGKRDLGGLRNFQKYLLPRLHKLGLDAIWFNPTNPGGYAPTEYFDVDPHYGTLDDLKDVCADAHGRGMRIWLDLIPHGPREHSAAGEEILKNNPEWVSREEDGAIKYWWGCLCCDYAHPGWQAYQADMATFFVKRCGIDGWRVDCAAGSPPNERPYDKLRPSQSGPYGALHLLAKVRKEMRATKADSALLGETGSAMHLSQCDFVYDWSSERGPLYSLAHMAPEEWCQLTKTWLERQQAALPEGAEFGLMRFLENHDQYKSVRKFGVGHEKALLSLCSLIPGLVFVFHEQDLGFGPDIKRLFEIRKLFEEFRRGRSIYAETASSVPSVLTFTRVLHDKFSAVAINFSRDEQSVNIELPLEQFAEASMGVSYSACDVYNGSALGTKPLSDWRRLALTVPPYETRVVVFRRADQPKIPVAEKHERPAPKTPKPLTVSQEGNKITAENAFYHIELSNGLIKSLNDSSHEPLLKSMNIIEGKRKVWPGTRLDFAASIKARGSVKREGGTAIVTFEGALNRSPEVTIPWAVTYALDDSPEIGLDFVLNAPTFERPIRGQLGMELQFGDADEWSVNTLEGQLHDWFTVTHPLGDMLTSFRYWHRSGLLWEATLFPLDHEEPVVSAKIGSTWLNVILPPLLAGFENALLRERSSSGEMGLTLHLAFLDEKCRANLAKPLRAAFTLQIGTKPIQPAGLLPGKDWKLTTEGSQYTFRNSHYELTVCRGLGGSIASLAQPGGQSIITSSEIYSDKGIYSTRKNSIGKEVTTSGSSKNDFEPDVFLRDTDRGMDLTLSSFLRLSYWNWANVASPRVQYELCYGLDHSPRIRVTCRARPMIVNRSLKAFLAQVLRIPYARRWLVDSVQGKLSGEFSSENGRGRVWQSRDMPLSDGGAMEIESLDGTVLCFGGVEAKKEDVQNVFLLDGGKNLAVVFFAFFDGHTESYQPAWRAMSYTMELTRP